MRGIDSRRVNMRDIARAKEIWDGFIEQSKYEGY